MAQARFANLLHGNWLAETSQAVCEGGAGLLRVDPAGSVAAKVVRVCFLDPVYRGGVMTVGLRWEAAGAAGALFPVLDANISISPARGRPGAASQGTNVTIRGPKCSVALPVRTDALGYVHDGLAVPVRFVVFPAADRGGHRTGGLVRRRSRGSLSARPLSGRGQ